MSTFTKAIGFSVLVRPAFLVGFLVLLLSVAACGGQTAPPLTTPPTSAISPEEARGMLEDALVAFNAGDYTAYTRQWSDTLKSAISEAAFMSFREQALQSTGAFVAIEHVELRHGNTQGYIRWVATAAFENARVEFGLGLPTTGTIVEGAFFDTVK